MQETRHIYVLLTDTGTLFTKLIRVFTGAELNHASIAFDQELTEVYSFGRKKISNPLLAGFVKEDLNSELFKSCECALYCCTVSSDTYEQIRSHINEIERNKELYKYNLLGLFGVLFNIQINRERAYFCSQFVATILKENGVAISPKEPVFVTPQDIEQAPVLNEVYRGCLQKYLGKRRMKRSRSMSA
ncbi:hypothetical protein E0485_01425 [Paenibacillus albiflavus]|uniref:Uncharacterized protein n=1 Tax=Paenibacillus albiflavus TaxID=2545760 RepID=A0A4R4EQS4_9BACL|nr:hypothetical protein [Paenibacillus albiflavus]TCZ80971.1 hypothetical protein E0485_01425 [Paenibacillus albiflavus]